MNIKMVQMDIKQDVCTSFSRKIEEFVLLFGWAGAGRGDQVNARYLWK